VLARNGETPHSFRRNDAAPNRTSLGVVTIRGFATTCASSPSPATALHIAGHTGTR
jgi:hypothetical protein